MLSEDQVNQIAAAYLEEIAKALQGQKSSLKMYPTLLQPLSEVKTGEALVLGVGGSHLYGARVRVNSGQLTVDSYNPQPLKRQQFQGAEEFVDLVVDSLQSVIEAGGYDALGIVYSFPGRAIKADYGLDLTSDASLPKGFVIPGIEDQPLGELFRQKLQTNLPTVVLNDTPAVLLAAEAKVGGVVGTGFNLAFNIDNQIYNSESGGFEVLGLGKAEELIGGMYLKDKQLSAQLVGVLVGSFIKGYVEEGVVKVAMEGSVFWQEEGYADLAKDTAEAVSGKKIELVNIPHASIQGAGKLALSLIKD